MDTILCIVATYFFTYKAKLKDEEGGIAKELLSV
jgi:hypothetical protein